MDSPETPPQRPRIPIKLVLLVALVIGLIVLISTMGVGAAKDLLEDVRAYGTLSILLYASLLYALLLAIPFIPGLEIGVFMIIIFGELGILAMYLSTIVGLNLSFAMGRLIPLRHLPKSFRKNVEQMGDLKRHNRSRINRYVELLVGDGKSARHYVGAAFLFNMPGNFVLGGGGGIGVFCGANRRFAWLPYALTVILAAGVIPALAYLGLVNLARFA